MVKVIALCIFSLVLQSFGYRIFPFKGLREDIEAGGVVEGSRQARINLIQRINGQLSSRQNFPTKAIDAVPQVQEAWRLWAFNIIMQPTDRLTHVPMFRRVF